ncbi:MAG TPA: hypothetical protein ENK18_23495 [Deltaproteobacteria bacterium]|nr:hypothetical protein [Deltaproteobacteria bacterium]
MQAPWGQDPTRGARWPGSAAPQRPPAPSPAPQRPPAPSPAPQRPPAPGPAGAHAGALERLEP